MTKSKFLKPALVAISVSVTAASPAWCGDTPCGLDGIAPQRAARQLAAVPPIGQADASAWSVQQLEQERQRYQTQVPRAEVTGSQSSDQQQSAGSQQVFDAKTTSRASKNDQLCGFAMGYQWGYSRGWQQAGSDCMKRLEAQSTAKSSKDYRRQGEVRVNKSMTELDEWYSVDLRDCYNGVFTSEDSLSPAGETLQRSAYTTGFGEAYWSAALAATEDWRFFRPATYMEVWRAPTKQECESRSYRRAATAVYGYAEKIGAPESLATTYLKHIRPGQ
jgi:hypothetical protein